jgi:tol-pal system protein YbgF
MVNLRKQKKKFADFLVKYPGHQLRENAVFWHAESFYRQDDWNQAAIQYLKAYQEYPKGAKAADSLLKLSLSLGALDKVKEACNILDKLDKEFPTRPASSVSRSSEAKRNLIVKLMQNKQRF